MGTNIRYQSQFNGYENFRDITNMPVTKLAAGTRNVVIPSGEKIDVRGGTDYLGVAGTVGVNTDTYWTIAHRIHSSYDPFVNSFGWVIPLRVFYQGHTANGDVIEAWLPIFSGGVDTGVKKWYQITETLPATPMLSSHKYYWAEQFDTANLTPRLVFTRGKTSIGSWSGGVANVVSLTPTTISTAVGTTWAQHGFVPAPNGVATVVINGVLYVVTAGFNTNTITVASTAGVSVDNMAFQIVQQDVPSGSSIVFDVCTAILNQVYYFSWTSRNFFVSWNRNQTQSVTVPSAIVTSALNDATFSGTYTGPINHNFTVTIDTIAPFTSYSSTGPNGLDDATYNTSAYSGGVGPNVYKTIVVADFNLVVPNGTGFVEGEIIKGNTSNAEALLIASHTLGIHDELGLVMRSGQFIAGEVVTGLSSSIVATTSNASYQNWIQLYKNDVPKMINNGIETNFTVALYNTAVINLVDGITITFGNWYGHAVGDSWIITINSTKTVDTFSWALDGVAQGSKIPITSAAQLLTFGISVTIANKTGHAVGDAWTITAFPTVTKSWIQFWYSVPSRFPGEGWTGLLDSNGWTAQPQEKTIYAVDQAGHYYELGTRLSSDLLSESIITDRLKSEPRNKPLYPYLINYIQNQFSIISQDKTFDILGRLKLLELPQVKSISDEVRTDFVNSDWEDGNIAYYGRRQYFSVPRDGVLFVHDQFKNYWQAPNTFGRRIGLLAVIDGKLCAHSYERNETYQLFTSSLNDLGEFPIDTKIIFPYDSGKSRYTYKGATAIGFEGFMKGKPDIDWKINASVGGSSQTEFQRQGKIKPWVTKAGLSVPADVSSLGKSSLGYHGLGNSPVTVPPNFRYIKTFNNIGYYLRNIEISCLDLEQDWSLISLGTDLSNTDISNQDIVDPDPLV